MRSRRSVVARGSSLHGPGVWTVGAVLVVGVWGYQDWPGVRPAGAVRRVPYAAVRGSDDARGARVGRWSKHQGRLARLFAARVFQRGALYGAADARDSVHALGDGGGRDLPAANTCRVFVLRDAGRIPIGCEGRGPLSRLLRRRGGERGESLRSLARDAARGCLRGGLGRLLGLGYRLLQKVWGEPLDAVGGRGTVPARWHLPHGPGARTGASVRNLLDRDLRRELVPRLARLGPPGVAVPGRELELAATGRRRPRRFRHLPCQLAGLATRCGGEKVGVTR